MSTTSPAKALAAIRVVHTAVWTFFVLCILAIPAFACSANYRYAALFIGVVFIEVLVLVLNGWRCPLTPIAARYTDNRRDNFDIFLPEWLARHNKLICNSSAPLKILRDKSFCFC